MTPRGSPAGIVFRRLDADPERRRAARLLPDCGLDDHDARCVWYGLCDLTATTASGLVGVAVVRPVDATTARLCGLAVRAAQRDTHLGRRLVSEVADALRASGVEELTAPPAPDQGVASLLARTGFVPWEQGQGRGPGWSQLPL
ncbi:acetyltransferase (GNAT) family protein [Geodermatophilus normandii]|uniref:Acetyltransferase (GNAT) family protein n=1 Tax=Geodermatophilus normandii TaxID=1137989 RepID=A0A317QMZ9_9ACTN|nr:GNAT family N-acetyltransferase [Geodermatophilus normandii]PWW24217.1 acetyltransferase (GNAT) family protein [Geodermatophilus normandii]